MVTPIKPKTLVERQTDTASTSGAIQNPMQQMQQSFNFFGNSSGLDAGSVNANGQKPSATPPSSSLGQSMAANSTLPSGVYGAGKDTAINNGTDKKDSATAYLSQGAGKPIFDNYFKKQEEQGLMA